MILATNPLPGPAVSSTGGSVSFSTRLRQMVFLAAAALSTQVFAHDGVCVRDVYVRPQAQESCDPLYTAVGSNACAQTQCPANGTALGMLCVPKSAGSLPAPALQAEQSRIAIDLAYTQILAAGAAGPSLAQARQTGRPEPQAELAAERAAVAALDGIYAQLMPSMLANGGESRPNRADLQQALGLRQRSELFTTKALALTQQADLYPVRSPACGDTQKRSFSSQKTAPVVASTPYAMAMASGAKDGTVLKLKSDPQQCVAMRPGAVAQLQLGPCTPFTPAHHLFLQGNGKPLLAHGFGAAQCVRANHAGALYVSRCESAAPLPNWVAIPHGQPGEQPGFQLKLQTADQCVSVVRDGLLRLQPCAAPRASGLEAQVFVAIPFKL